jgi:tryptophan-rich sensory protein
MENLVVKKQNKYVYKLKKFLSEYWWQILASFGGVALVAVLGGLFLAPDANWFLNLAKPQFYPPDEIFLIIQTILYFLIAIGLVLVLKNNKGKKLIVLYIINGVLIILWNAVLFSLMSLFVGVIILAILVFFAYLLVKQLFETNRPAFYLMLPYFIWLIFTFLLNYSLYFLN